LFIAANYPICRPFMLMPGRDTPSTDNQHEIIDNRWNHDRIGPMQVPRAPSRHCFTIPPSTLTIPAMSLSKAAAFTGWTF